MLINVNYLGNCTNNKKSSPDLQSVLQFPLQTLQRTFRPDISRVTVKRHAVSQ